MKQDYGEVVAAWIKSDLYVMISDPKDVEVSEANLQFFKFRRF